MVKPDLILKDTKYIIFLSLFFTLLILGISLPKSLHLAYSQIEYNSTSNSNV